MSNDIPQEITEIAELLTKLELAFRGKIDGHATIRYEISNRDLETGFLVGTPDATQYASTDWIAEQNDHGALTLKAEVSLKNYYSYFVTEDTLAVIKPVILQKIAEVEAEHEVLRKTELKETIKKEFAKAWIITPEKAVSMGLKDDLGERTYSDLDREAVIAHLWLNPDERENFPESMTFFNNVAKTLDDADSEKLLDDAERQETIKAAGEQFIATRKLKNTIQELGEDIHILHPQLTF